MEANCEKCFSSKDSILSLLTEEQNQFVRENHYCSLYKKNEIIYKEGDIPIGLMILSEGKSKIFRKGIGQREQIVRMVKPFELMGYRALFAGESHITCNSAIEDSIVCIIKKDILFKLLKENSSFALGIIQTLATKLGFSESRTVTLTQKHIRGRLAESLLFLKDTYGVERDESTINVYLSREDIANLSNMTTSNAIRTLSAFAEEGIINISGRKIKIVEEKALQKISSLG